MLVDQELHGDGLPTYLTRFIGRVEQLSALEALLVHERLITICGVGGSGKTRLSVELARRIAGGAGRSRFRDGICWVALAAAEPEVVPRTIAAALGLREASSERPSESLVRALAADRRLLILDNCEHVLEACRTLLADLLPRCPNVAVLTTSRSALHADTEYVLPIPPLGTTGSDARSDDAVAMFVDRVAMTSPGYALTGLNAATIRAICTQVEGLPLAIELAASWVRVVSPRDLLTDLETAASSLTSAGAAVADRHRSMRAVLDSSWQWLEADERRAFTCLGVFVGGFTRAAAEAVGGASLSTLASLTERALIQRMPDPVGGTRYHIHELVRTYAVERLESLDAAAVSAIRARHFDFFLRLAEDAEAAWDTAAEADWIARLQNDAANVEAALAWAIAAGEGERALQMAAGLFSFWIYTSPLRQLEALLTRILALSWDTSSTTAMRARARVLNIAGFVGITVGFSAARDQFAEGLRLYERLGDNRGIAWSLRGIGFAELVTGRLTGRPAAQERSLAISRAIGDEAGIVWSVHDLGQAALAAGDLDQAIRNFTQSAERFGELGISYGQYRAHALLGDVHRRRSEWVTALGHYRVALDLERRIRFATRAAELLEGVAGVAAGMRHPEEAATLIGAGEVWRETFGFPRPLGFQPSFEQDLQLTRRQLSPPAFDAAYGRGRRMSTAQAETALADAIDDLTALASPAPAGLTAREVEVLRLVASGLSNADIADRLVVSPRTVHAHLRSVFDKLGVATRTAAAREAVRLNLS